MPICIVYDCLFPHTVGGAERWYRNLAERLVEEGHEVTYLTLRQWDRGAAPDIDSRVRVIAVGPQLGLYTDDGRRRIGPPLVFGAGVLWHLLVYGRRYAAVHTASFPYFSLLAAAITRPVHGYVLVVDWHEVWSGTYWRKYLGKVKGRIGHAVQKRCARVSQRAFCFSRLHAQRLYDEGLRGEVTILRGQYRGTHETHEPRPAGPLVLFAGRLIPEKRAPAVVGAVAASRIRGLHGVVLGDGPERQAVLDAVAQTDAPVAVPGFVSSEEVEDQLGRAMCMLLPSAREGYGMIVVEASSYGTPSIVVAGPDNAATERIVEDENGFVAPSAAPADLAAAIDRVADGGEALRQRTREWFAAHVDELSIEHSLATVLESYGARDR